MSVKKSVLEDYSFLTRAHIKVDTTYCIAFHTHTYMFSSVHSAFHLTRKYKEINRISKYKEKLQMPMQESALRKSSTLPSESPFVVIM